MASSSLGLFGDFKYAHSTGKKTPPFTETVWVSRPYDPLDVRDSAPVPQKKIINFPKDPNELPPEWRPPRQQSVTDISRRSEESRIYPSLRITRCEEWSTLREMLPSRGRPVRFEHPKWGTGLGSSPQMIPERAKRHPIITSAMSRFVSVDVSKERFRWKRTITSVRHLT